MEEQNKLLMQMNQMLAAQNERQAAQIQALTARIDELLQRIDELSHKKNSRNSSVPPSSEGYSQEPAEIHRCETRRSDRS